MINKLMTKRHTLHKSGHISPAKSSTSRLSRKPCGFHSTCATGQYTAMCQARRKKISPNTFTRSVNTSENNR
jgi:hypothetical protein